MIAIPDAVRTYAFGALVGERRGLRFDRELCIAAVPHDLGLAEQATAAARFALEGADAAKELLARAGMADADVEVVWDAIVADVIERRGGIRAPDVCDMLRRASFAE